MRPYIYATDWSYQFELIDERVRIIKENEAKNKVNETEKQTK